MEKLVSDLFVEFKNDLDSNYKFGPLKKLSDYKMPVSLQTISDSMKKGSYLSNRNHMKKCLEMWKKYGVVKESESKYELSETGTYILDEVLTKPDIRGIRNTTRANGHANCTEEKILIYLNRGNRTLKQIESGIGYSSRIAYRGIENLKRIKAIKTTSKNMTVIRVSKKADTSDLFKNEKIVFDIVVQNGKKLIGRNQPMEMPGGDIIKMTNNGIYSHGTNGLIRRGIASKRKKELYYNLNVYGKELADSIKSIDLVLKKV